MSVPTTLGGLPRLARRALGLQTPWGLLLVFLALAPVLVLQWRAPVPRLEADAVEYYAHLRSLYFDRDLEFTNEFDHFGILDRWDKTNPTVTGHRRTNFSIGPALFWMPFYALGDIAARATGGVEEGYSALHIRSVAFASAIYGVAGVLLVFGLLRTLVRSSVAFWTSIVVLYGTFLIWYTTHEATVSHAVSFFAGALVLRVWWGGRDSLGLWRAAILGLLIGLAATVRWQNGVLLLLPAFTAARALKARPRAAMGAALACLAGFAIGVLPQLLAFKAIFGTYVLPYPVQGRDYLRLDRPRILEALFSSRHGLLFWTPILWGGFIGILGLLRRRRTTAVVLVLLLAVMTYVNGASADWWAGGSFSNRRFDSVLPVLAVGLGYCFEYLRNIAERRPWAVLVVGGLGLGLWNFLFMESYRTYAIPRDQTVSFAEVTRRNTERLTELIGSPVAWPANWLFARDHGLPAAQYDEMVGKYLFFRQNNLGGVVDLGDPRVDPALLGEGWSARLLLEGAVCRRVDSRARLFVALDKPEDLDLVVHVAGTGTVTLWLNRREAAAFPLTGVLTPLRASLPAYLLVPQLNEIALQVAPGGAAIVDRFVFKRRGQAASEGS